MAEQVQPNNGDTHNQNNHLARRARFFAVVYRFVLIIGLLALVTAVVALLVTDLFTAWILLLPAFLIALGIILARVEYRLDMRLYHLHKQDPINGSH